MIVNRIILSEYIDDSLITYLFSKSLKLSIESRFEKMIEDRTGALKFMVHFDLNELIEAQEKYVELVRKDFALHNKLVLQELIIIRKSILKEDLDASKN